MTSIVQAIVLDYKPRGEYDLLFTLFSKENGKIKAVAKGVKRMNAKLRGCLEIGNEVQLMIARGKNMMYIAGCDTMAVHRTLRQDGQKILLWQALIETVITSTVPENVEREVYMLLVHWPQFLFANFRDLPRRNLIVTYLVIWKYLSEIGLSPELFECVRSGRKLQSGDTFFSLLDGGLVSALNAKATDLYLSLTAVKCIRYVWSDNFWGKLSDVYKFKLTAKEEDEIIDWLKSYVRQMLEKDYNSIKYWQKLYFYGDKILA
jgi:DNA repair protein RecO (recombination protein O)